MIAEHDLDAPAEDEAGDALPPAWRLALPAILVGTVLALVGLDRRPLWLDESFSLGATNQLAETVAGTSGTMLGYYAVLTPWSAVSESVWWLRLLSVLVAAVALVPVASLARRLGGPTLAVRATVALALAAQMTRYAQEARSYALVVLLVATSWWCLVRGVEETDPARRRRAWALLALLSAAAVLSHGLAVLNVLAIGVAAVLAPDRRRTAREVAPAVLGALAVIGLLLAAGANDVGTWVAALSPAQVGGVVLAYTSPVAVLAAVLTAPVALGAVGSVLAWRDPDQPDAHARWLALLPVLWVVVPAGGLLVLSVVRPSLDHRYLIGILPGVALLLARATVIVDGAVRRPVRTVGPAALAVAALLVVGQVEVHADTGDDWRGAAALVAAEAVEGDGVSFPLDFHRTPFEAAWAEVDGSAAAPVPVQFARPLGTVRRHDPTLGPDEVDARVAEVERLWVVTALEPGVTTTTADDALAALGADGFVVVRDVAFDGDVRVVLLEADA